MMITSKLTVLTRSSSVLSGCCHQISEVGYAVSNRRFHQGLLPVLKRRKLLRYSSGACESTAVGTSKYRGISVFSGAKCSSVRAEEVGKFERMAASWWNQSTSGQMKELHSMNKLRVPFIRDGILQQRKQSGAGAKVPLPLEGFQILDVGCGGGILCEPLARLGAVVKGIDPGKENITVARNHLPQELESRLSYECISIEDLASTETCKFDAVVMSEVIEHIENPENFIKTATDVLKPGGSLFLTTLNRTMESWMGAIVAWEYLLRKLPVGTHDWKKFLTPQEIEKIFKSSGLKTVLIHGMCYNPLNNSWKWSNQRAINYAMHAVKIQ